MSGGTNNGLERTIALTLENGLAQQFSLRDEARNTITRQLRDGTIRIEPRAGNSPETSIRILGNIDGITGLLLEKIIQVFLVYAKKLPEGLTFKGQRTAQHEGRNQDVITLGGTDGEERVIHFDVHDWLGKSIDQLGEREPMTTTRAVRIIRERLDDEQMVFGEQVRTQLEALRASQLGREAFLGFQGNAEFDLIFFNPQFGIDHDLRRLLGAEDRQISTPEIHQLIEQAVDDRVVRGKAVTRGTVRLESMDAFGERIKGILKLLFA